MTSPRYQSPRRRGAFSWIDDLYSHLFDLAIIASVLFYVFMHMLLYCISILISICSGIIWLLLSPFISLLGQSSSSSSSSAVSSSLEIVQQYVEFENETSSWSLFTPLFLPFRLFGAIWSWILSPSVLVTGLVLLGIFSLSSKSETKPKKKKSRGDGGNNNNNTRHVVTEEIGEHQREPVSTITRGFSASALFARMTMHTCVVAAHCEGKPVLRGIECDSAEDVDGEKHFFCTQDFIEYVESEDKHPSGKIVYDPELGECKIFCPCCTSQANPPSTFSRTSALEVIGSYRFYKIETKCRERFNEDARRTTVEDLQTTNPLDIHKRQIIHNLAVNKCPKCYEGFDLFSGCAVVTCARPLCQAIFCGLCLDLLVKETSHEHVKSCSLNIWNKGGYSIPEANLIKIHRKRKAKSVQAYLKTLSKDTQARLIADSEVTMLLTNLEIVDMSGKKVSRWGFFSRQRRTSSLTSDPPLLPPLGE